MRDRLRRLHELAGSPTKDRLVEHSDRAGHDVSRSALAAVTVDGLSAPRWGTVEAFIDACAGYARARKRPLPAEETDIAAWRTRYDQAYSDRRQNRPPQAGGLPASAATALVLADRTPYAASPGAVLPLRAGVVPPRAASFQQRTASDRLAQGADDVDTAGQISDGVAGATVLSGLGGVGKTQLAADYAERLWDAGEVELLVWVTAGSHDAVVSEYARVAAALTGVDEPDLEVGARRLLEWLAGTRARWLVVLDDVSKPGDIDGLWPPPTQTGQVLVTTRRQDAAMRGHRRQIVEVGVFTPQEAETYLRSTLANQPQLLVGVDNIAQDLGRLPLALAQAAAYMLDRNLCCADYRMRLADRRRLAAVLPDGDALPDGHRATVAATWSLSVEQADRLEPAGLAKPLLEVASLMDANGIPADVLTSPAVVRWLSQSAGRDVTPEDARDALGCLRRLSLLTFAPLTPHQAVRVHALVQRATRDNASKDRVRTIARIVAEALLETWPVIERDSSLSQVLRANAEALDVAAGEHLWADGAHRVLFRVGQSLGHGGLVVQARDWYSRLRDVAAEQLGPDHRAVLTARHNHASCRGEAGDPIGAVIEFEALLVDQTRALGADHPDTLVTRHNLAALHAESGVLHQALHEFETLLADQTRLLGADHPDTLGTRGNLASWRGEAGDPCRAVTELEEVLRDKGRVLGAEDVDSLATRSSLARWRREAGDRDGAVADMEVVLAGRLNAFGPDHPSTLATRGTLARWRALHGTAADAVVELEAVLADHVRALGPDHHFTMTARLNLATWRGKAGDVARAISELTVVLADDTRVLGADHPDTLLTRANLARWRGEAGDPAGAVSELDTLLAEQLRVLGPTHSDVLITRSNLALWHSRLQTSKPADESKLQR